MELRMAPLQEQYQHRLSFGLDIGPATSVKSYFDWLGNTIHAFSINAFAQSNSNHCDKHRANRSAQY